MPHSPAPARVVVFGATGRIGSELVKLLARDPRCAEVIALSRRPDGPRARWLAALSPTVTVRAFDVDDLGPACAGATDAFVVAPLAGGVSGVAAWHETVGAALAAAGVGQIVKVSVTGARAPDSDPPPGPLPSMHWAGEEAFRATGVLTSVIRPTIFMQHCEMGTGLYTRGDDRLFLPTGDAGVAFLDCRDIAAAGHALLLSPDAAPHRGAAFELTGPEAVTAARMAEILGAIRGAPVRHIDGMEAFAARQAEVGAPTGFQNVYGEAAGSWFAALSTERFEAITGRRPRSFAAYADDRAPFFRS
jgi:NAD(P)H dehydrogenase (quinone)